MKKLSLFLVALTMILLSCKPEAEKPTVVTKSVGEVTKTSAKVVGQVTADGGAEITERGVCWNTAPAPEVIDYRTKVAEGGLGIFTLNLSNLEPQTTYYVRAYATNEVGTAYGEEVSFTTLETNANGREYVDLGLSVKWATCNIGATSPEEYGDYFAWGETSTKSDYSSSNCPTYGLSISQLQSQGYIDSEGNLTSQYDAATANWGGDWRMPTEAEQEELLNNCTWTWTTQNGVNGYKVEGPNGNSIFLPAAGYLDGSSLSYAGSGGGYWSSAPNESNGNGACGLYFYSDDRILLYNYRYYGHSVRSILE